MNYSPENNKKRLRYYKSHGKKLKNKLGFVILRISIALLLVGTFALAGAGIGTYMGVISNAPPLPNINADLMMGNFDTVLLDVYGNEFERLDGGENREFAEWEQIPEHLINAFIAIEDERFWEHNGIDGRGIIRAIYQTLMHDNTQGASTITQQLIKNQLGIMRNTIETKLQEQYLAVRYEAHLTELLGSRQAAKERILHEYLNIIALGHGQIGVQAAARFYFGKDVSELTLSESAVIASITQNPTGLSPRNFPDDNRRRQVNVLNNMLEQELITAAEHIYAINDIAVFDRVHQHQAIIEEEGRAMSFFTNAVIDQVVRDLQHRAGFSNFDANAFTFGGGIVIHTTMNPVAQAIIDEVFTDESFFPTNPQDFELYVRYYVTIRNTITGNQVNRERQTSHWIRSGRPRKQTEELVEEFITWARNDVMGLGYEVVAERYHVFPQPQSSMIIIDHNNGHVLAMAGQRGEHEGARTFNRAVNSARQPGSVFKMLASYAPAFDVGTLTAARTIDDVPNIHLDQHQEYVVWPSNWYSNPPYRGRRSAREAIEQSMNVSAVRALNQVGIDVAFNYLLNFGFTTLTDDDRVPALALGGINGVTNLEMTAAFGAIANGGILYQSILYTRVYDRHGNILIDNTNLAPNQVLNRNSAYILTDTMRGVLTRGTGGSARFQNLQMDIAGKTGTTQEGRDLYFVGYSPHLTAGVWVGHDTPRPMTGNVTGSNRFDTRIWSHVMERVHYELDLQNVRFERPQGFVYHSICMDSGLLAIPGVCTHDPRGNRVRSELFAPGTVPTHQCDVHMAFYTNPQTGAHTANGLPGFARRVGIIRDRSFMAHTGNVSIADAAFEVPQSVFGNFVHGFALETVWDDEVLYTLDENDNDEYDDYDEYIEDNDNDNDLGTMPEAPDVNFNQPPVIVVPTPTPTPSPTLNQPQASPSPPIMTTPEPTPMRTPLIMPGDEPTEPPIIIMPDEAPIIEVPIIEAPIIEALPEPKPEPEPVIQGPAFGLPTMP